MCRLESREVQEDTRMCSQHNTITLHPFLQAEATYPDIPKLTLPPANSDQPSAATFAPAVCDSPVVSQRTARAATTRGVQAPMGETADVPQALADPEPSLAADETEPHVEGDEEGLATFLPPAGTSEAPADSPR